MAHVPFPAFGQTWRKRTRAILALLVFLSAFLPRVIYPVSRPVQWYMRSVLFIQHVLDGSWGETVYSEHPGVPIMWLAGSALRLAGVAAEQRPEGPYVDPASLTAREAAIGVAPLALAIALLIALSYRLLARLFDEWIALAAAVLMALDPFYIANSKVMHVDGFLAACMTCAGLSVLVYVKERQWRWAAFSGALAGLALLTKAPAAFLVPYAGLVLLVAIWSDRGVSWRRVGLAGGVWLAAAVLVYCMLFPAMWVDPLATLNRIYTRALRHIGTAHPNPLYFAGRVLVSDPGPTYYLATWAFKITAPVALFAVLGVAYSLLARGWERQGRITTWLMLAYALFFSLQMTLGAKKMPRYLLPAWPMADALAGVGLVMWARQIGRVASRLATRLHQARVAIFVPLVACGLLVQAALALPRHPYYDTYFNELAGSVRSGVNTLSTQWQGEGLDLVARHMNTWPAADRLTVATHRAILFRQYFIGQTVDLPLPAEWVVLGIHNVLKGGEEAEMRVVDFYRRRRPDSSILFDGIPYAGIYRASPLPQLETDYTFETGIALTGYDIPTDYIYAGDTLRLQLYWQAERRPIEDYVAFVHLLDPFGRLVAQQDNPPVRGSRPTSSWQPDEVIVDPYDITVPPDALPGRYTLAVGLYRWPALSRLAVHDRGGAPLPDACVVLTALQVEKEPPPTRTGVARGLAALVLLSALAGWALERKTNE